MKQKNLEILMVIVALSNLAVWLTIALNVMRSTFLFLTGTSTTVLFTGLILLHYFKFTKTA